MLRARLQFRICGCIQLYNTYSTLLLRNASMLLWFDMHLDMKTKNTTAQVYRQSRNRTRDDENGKGEGGGRGNVY